jgi:alpha-L-rhamnosidase
MGATTIWERWDAVKPDGTLNSTGMTSLNHYALGAMVDWLHRVVGGLDRAAPGYRRLRIAPQPGGGLEHAATRLRTPFGEARVNWRRADQTLTLEAVIPEGSTAEVVLPLHPAGQVEQVEAGSYRWSYEALATPPRRYTLETTMRELAAAPELWAVIRPALASHLPEQAVDGLARMWPDAPLRELLLRVPSADAALEHELLAALESPSR